MLSSQRHAVKIDGVCDSWRGTWDRFDICEAWYVFASEYHGGQWSPEYRILGRLARIGFRPSPMLSRRNLSRNAHRILASLVLRQKRGVAIGLGGGER